VLVVLLGVVIGNIVRGIPSDDSGFLSVPLIRSLTVVTPAGILDWYTLLVGLSALFMLAAHGSYYVSWRSTGNLRRRTRRLALNTTYAVIVYSVLVLLSTTVIKPDVWSNYYRYPPGFFIPALVVACLAGMLNNTLNDRDLAAFVYSLILIPAVLASIAFSLYPSVLPSGTNPEYSLTIYDHTSGNFSQKPEWLIAIVGLVLLGVYGAYVIGIARRKSVVK
jgi:cytochrome d ubiquinol oxidase subunit II